MYVQVEKWNDDRSQGTSPSSPITGAESGGDPDVTKYTQIGDAGTVQHPVHLAPSNAFTPAGASTSTIITLSEASALASAFPGRRQMSEWRLRYSTDNGGFSLNSLYRAGAACARSLLVVEDFNGFVFGAFCTDAWKVNPRYQGTGECFVFQMRPHAIKYGWDQRAEIPGRPHARNDFFMLLGTESAGFGGAPHFAIWLDSDLLHGNSGLCHTFASPTLSGSEDFKVKALELWQIGS